jgi:hypothetical protein
MVKHYITKCSCGNVIAQCRCPSTEKVAQTIDRGCSSCHQATANVSRHGENWRVDDGFGRYVMLSRADWERVNSVIHGHYHGED